jgi:ankyrin repeat protein
MKNPTLYKKFKDMSQHSLNVHCCSACGKGDFEVIQYLLFSPELEKHAQLDYVKNKGLSFASRNGHINIIRYFLLEQKIVDIDIHARQDEMLYSAVEGGQLGVIQYLLKSPELKEHANLKNNEYIVKAAFLSGHLNIVKYFLNDLKNEIDFDTNNLFMIAYSKGHNDILEYLIFEAKIEMSVSIKTHLDYRSDTFSKRIEAMFAKRDEYTALNQELIKNKEPNKKSFKL